MKKIFPNINDLATHCASFNPALAERVCFLARRLRLLCQEIGVDFDWNSLKEIEPTVQFAPVKKSEPTEPQREQWADFEHLAGEFERLFPAYPDMCVFKIERKEQE